MKLTVGNALTCEKLYDDRHLHVNYMDKLLMHQMHQCWTPAGPVDSVVLSLSDTKEIQHQDILSPSRRLRSESIKRVGIETDILEKESPQDRCSPVKDLKSGIRSRAGFSITSCAPARNPPVLPRCAVFRAVRSMPARRSNNVSLRCDITNRKIVVPRLV
jgi:hypothetical protein